MLKQSPSRNQRSRGFKVKHALQICLLLAICIWLLYQVKHSRDKKASYEESSAKLAEKVQSGHGILRLGRKNLHPRVDEIVSENERRGEEEEEQPEEEENEDEGRGGGDDEIDGRDEERAEEEESEQGEDLIDEEDKVSEEESEEKESGNQNEDVDLSDDRKHGGVERNSQEAREEQYTGDDASSAVVHNTQTVTVETEKGVLRKVKEEEQVESTEMNELEQLSKTNNTEEINVDGKVSDPKVGEGETAENNASGNDVGSEGKGNQFNLTESDVGSIYNSSMEAESNEQAEVNDNSTMTQEEKPISQNGTYILVESVQNDNVTSNEIHSNLQTVVLEESENTNRTGETDESDFNATLSITTGNSEAAERELTDSSDSESAVPIQIVKFDATAGTEEGSDSTTTDENDDKFHSGYSNATVGAEEVEEISASSTTNEIEDAAQNESFDSSDSSFYQEDRDDHTDLEALPEIGIELSNSEDAVE